MVKKRARGGDILILSRSRALDRLGRASRAYDSLPNDPNKGGKRSGRRRDADSYRWIQGF